MDSRCFLWSLASHSPSHNFFLPNSPVAVPLTPPLRDPFQGAGQISSSNWLPVVLLFQNLPAVLYMLPPVGTISWGWNLFLGNRRRAPRVQRGLISSWVRWFFLLWDEMADVIILCCDSLSSSCSLLTDFSSSARQRGGRRGSIALVSGLCSVGCPFVSPIAVTTRRRLANFVVTVQFFFSLKFWW